jgi:hypothetical protein
LWIEASRTTRSGGCECSYGHGRGLPTGGPKRERSRTFWQNAMVLVPVPVRNIPSRPVAGFVAHPIHCEYEPIKWLSRGKSVSKKSSPRRTRGNRRESLEATKARFSYRLSLAVLVVAAVTIILGAGMVFLGLQGSINWTMYVVGSVNAQLSNASPGIVFATIGLILVCVLLSQGPPTSPTPVRVGNASYRRSSV